jgi:hypothetical protein
MMNASGDWKVVLTVMSEAFSSGDNSRGEDLFWSALHAGAPWDVATSVAAQALSARVAAQRQHTAGTPAPA